MDNLTTEQIVDLIRRRRLLLRERMNNAIAQERCKTHDYAAMVNEYVSLEILLLAIETNRMDVWDVARGAAEIAA